MAKHRHEDDDESFDAADDGDPHVGDDDEAILYAEQLDQLAAAGFTETNALLGDAGFTPQGGIIDNPGLTIIGDAGPERVEPHDGHTQAVD